MYLHSGAATRQRYKIRLLRLQLEKPWLDQTVFLVTNRLPPADPWQSQRPGRCAIRPAMRKTVHTSKAASWQVHAYTNSRYGENLEGLVKPVQPDKSAVVKPTQALRLVSRGHGFEPGVIPDGADACCLSSSPLLNEAKTLFISCGNTWVQVSLGAQSLPLRCLHEVATCQRQRASRT